MSAKVTFFPVCNGDMTLIKFADQDETTLLIDVKIRAAADDPDGDKPDVATELRKRLKTDAKGRPYVDAFLLSHPDEDHCLGLTNHFYLGDLNKYPDDNKPQQEKRIVINEIWSSPIVFRRASKDHVICYDAEMFRKEVKRRIKVNEENSFYVDSGDKVLVMGEDIIDGKTGKPKTDPISPIVKKAGEKFSKINGKELWAAKFYLLAPSGMQDDETEELLSKNDSSVILNIKIAGDILNQDATRLLTGGDAGVVIWERMWDKYKEDSEALHYDLLQAPHHCSWRSLSSQSWSENNGKAKASENALNALGQIRANGCIVASCKPILDDCNDPPCIGAKREYKQMTNNSGGKFYCTGEYPKQSKLEPLEFEIDANGFKEGGGSNSSGNRRAVVAATPHKFGKFK